MSYLCATQSATVRFVNDTNAPVKIKIDRKEFLSLAPHTEASQWLAPPAWPGHRWVQVFDMAGNALTNEATLDSIRGLAPLKPGTMTTMDVGSGVVTVTNENGKVVLLVGSTRVGEKRAPLLPREGEEGLFAAAAEGSLRKARTLLKTVSPNIKDAQGNTPLHLAKNLRMVKLLVENGAQVNAKNNEGITRLHMDVVFGRLRYVQYLLDHGANVKITTNTGVTPLHLATMISFYESPREAIARVAGKLGSAGTVGAVALGAGSVGLMLSDVAVVAGMLQYLYFHVGVAGTVGVIGGTGFAAGVIAAAAVLGTVDIVIRMKIVEALLQKGANPNAQDEAGNAPLHTLAAGRLLKPGNRHGGILMAEHLIFGGAKRNLKNAKGQTPFDVAKEYHRLLLMPVLNPLRPRQRVNRAMFKVGEAVGKGVEKVGETVREGAGWVREKVEAVTE
jgi:ankyrin repeat protein